LPKAIIDLIIKSMIKKLPRGFASPIILLVVGLIVGIAATFLYFQLKPKPTTPSQTTQTEQTSTLTSSPKAFAQQATDETASWKTYTNTQYGFSFQFPSEWFNYDNPNNPSRVAVGFYPNGETPNPGEADYPTNALLSIEISDFKQSASEFENTASQTAGYQKTLTIAGYPAIQTQIKTFKQYYIKFSSSNVLILTTYTADAGSKLDTIVSLIKFTNH